LRHCEGLLGSSKSGQFCRHARQAARAANFSALEKDEASTMVQL